MPLPVANRPWGSITMDYLTSIPSSNGFDTILVVVDCFTKMAHFLPCQNSINSMETSTMVMNEIIKHHGLPDEIITDRDPKFRSKFTQEFYAALGVKYKMSTSGHAQTDGQSERTIQMLEGFLRAFMNYEQNNWHDFLSAAEIAYNNSFHSSIGVSPFFANYGFHPRFIPEGPKIMFINTPTKGLSSDASMLTSELKNLHDELKIILEETRSSMKKFADRKRLKAPELQIGQKVMLVRRHANIGRIPKTNRPNDKYDFRNLGPYTILEQINEVAYKLNLPATDKFHNVVHVSNLIAYHENTLEGREIPPPPPVSFEGEDEVEWQIERLVGFHIKRNKPYFMVKWLGYGVNESTLEPLENIHPELTKDWFELHPVEKEIWKSMNSSQPEAVPKKTSKKQKMT